MDALAGATTSGQYLRGNGTDVVMSAIQAADVPTLNQSTTGNAATATRVSNALTAGSGISFSSGTTYDGSAPITITSSVTSPIPAGTAMVFFQSSAPTGWTQVTTHNNKAMRVVSGAGGGSGGTVAFTTAFASQAVSGSVSITGISGSASATTLATSQLASHTHTYGVTPFDTSGQTVRASQGRQNSASANGTTNAEGGGGSHTHGFTFSSGSASFSGTAINLAVQYIDVIICTKN
jgi:hypothetical protein